MGSHMLDVIPPLPYSEGMCVVRVRFQRLQCPLLAESRRSSKGEIN